MTVHQRIENPVVVLRVQSNREDSFSKELRERLLSHPSTIYVLSVFGRVVMDPVSNNLTMSFEDARHSRLGQIDVDVVRKLARTAGKTNLAGNLLTPYEAVLMTRPYVPEIVGKQDQILENAFSKIEDASSASIVMQGINLYSGARYDTIESMREAKRFF